MIVDDMEIMRKELKSLKIWGESTGFVISEEAKNGQDAIDKLRENRVDLVITDIKMPVMDGVELLKNIIKEELCHYVVFLSEYTEFEYARQALVYGAFDYIVKPVNEENMKNLLLKVKEFLNKKKLEKEKIKSLESELEEKLEIYYAPEDVEELLRLFKEIDEGVIEEAGNLIERIGSAVDYDLLKLEFVIKRIITQLIKGLNENYPWLDKLADMKGFKDVDFTALLKFSHYKDKFLKIVKEFFSKIKKFEFGNEMSSMVRNICRIVLQSSEKHITSKIIAEQMFLSQSYLSNIFREKTGISIVEYITMVKMERAKILFKNIEIKNYEVSDLLGYKDVEYFGKIFKKYTGMTPSEYKISNKLKSHY